MHRTPAWLVVVASVLSLSAFAQSPAPAPAAPAAAAASDEVTPAQLDALFVKRADPGVTQQLEALSKKAVAAKPNDFELLWRAARVQNWIADSSSSKDVKKAAGKECWNLSERAIKQKPGAVEGHYYAACGIGQYSDAVGILTALGEGLEGKFNDRLDQAIKLDPSYDHGGPLFVKGRYFHELPWPKRDLGKSAEWLNRAIAKNPESLRAYYYLAATQLHDGKAKLAAESNAKALNGSTAYDPPEGEHVKRMAKALQVEIQKELK